MFLFTTPAEPRASAAPTPIVDAIRQGAEQTGTSFDYLLSTARRESSLDPAAKAPTSSATGLFQFIEQTWLGLIKSEGGKLGLSDLSAAVTARGDGTFAVPDGTAREAILKLREDPRLSAMMAGALTQQNREALASVTGREPTGGELYMAHLLGARGAAELIRAARQNPDRAVAADMPDAAAANRSIFFDRTGKARSAGELYALLGAAQPAGPVSTAPSPPRTVTNTGPAAVTRTGEGSPLLGLFRNEARIGPVSDAVAKLWRVNRGTAGQSAAYSYFPGREGADPAVEAAPPAPVASQPFAGTPANVPLPPPRPKAAARLAATGLPR